MAYKPKAVNTPGGHRYRLLWYLTFRAEGDFERLFEEGGFPGPYPSMTMDWFRAWMQRNRQEVEGEPNG